ncbi:YibE/F family protein [Enterococcus sp. SMC-9]|uniref:YibE/F family protein n=1 Tax=Enterococcus sp. SMC-9 TaxID=2862343 RepID=UPI001E472E59|nr:YibE/F family protein [Enterococcus sp. SMC-9]MCD1024399.1 YibE/F family protein [Enterococcus sp. SMC-9]
MNVLLFLFFILCLLSFLILGKPAFYLITGIFMTLCLFLVAIYLISRNFAVLPIFLVVLLALTGIILFYTNGFNPKTKLAFFCSVITFTLMILLIPLLTKSIAIAGFTPEEIDELATMNFAVPISYQALTTVLIIMSMAGAVIDASMAVASSLYELRYQGQLLSATALFQSSMKVVKEILGSSIHTLFFAFVANNLALIFWFSDLHYSFETLINAKAFVAELVISILAGIMTVATLPFTAYFGAKFFTR